MSWAGMARGGGVVISMESMSSGGVSWCWDGEPVGFRDMQSGALFLTPGIWTIRNRNLSFLLQISKSIVPHVGQRSVTKDPEQWFVVHCHD